MISTSEIKREIIFIITNYREQMTKELEQELINLHDTIESDKEDVWNIE